ncbi:response regulator [Candidatus Parabeggiatoa sp. HSG14]|uniref:response regulator n=1 Tax=Candidatus Parabeggiatoa sp. HSG14 TaxID=3055593 RepID=UPI0025A8C2FD|nr:response regulator [Thiotrichales bacterium HSG14]
MINTFQKNTETRITFFHSIRGKLVLLFLAVSLIPLAIVGGVAITQLNIAQFATSEVSDNYFPSIVNLDNAEIALLHIVEAQKNHIIAPDDETMRLMESKIKTQQETLMKALAGFESTLDVGIETEAFKKFQAILNAFLTANTQVITLSQTNDDDKAQTLSVGIVNDKLQNALNLMETMRETNIVGSNEAKRMAEKAVRTGVILTLIVSLVFAIIVILVALWVSHSIAKPILLITEAAHKLATGDTTLTGLDPIEVKKISHRKDEIGHIGQTFDELSRYFKEVINDLVQISQGLAKGNLHIMPQAEYRGDFVQIKNALETALSDQRQVIEDIVQVSQGLADGNLRVTPKAEYQGDFVQIKNALEIAAAKLSETTAKNTMQDWLKTGQAQLNAQMSGEQEVTTLAKNIISFLTTYTKAQVGLFYLLKAPKLPQQKPYLQVIAGYAYTPCDNIPTQFLLGDGLVGQAALDKKPIYHVHIPEEYTPIIQSGMAKSIPRYMLMLPFLYENEVKGVIEIGSTQALTSNQQIFLEQVVPGIGIVLNTAESRTKMQELLQQSQTQTEELQSQSEELQSQQEEMQQINEELQHQREELEEKQEELQQRNEELQNQSEELQTQSEELQTQQEELRQTNETLEERSKDLERQKQEVQHKNIALEKTQQSLEFKVHELEMASQYKSEFLANMSHELRTPLNSLLILSQLLTENKEENLSDKEVEYAHTINSAGSDLLILINDILDLSKVEAGKMEISIEELSLPDLVETLENKFRPVAEGKNLAFHTVIAEGLPPCIHSDRQRLKQILNNLLSNAFKFTNQGEVKLTIGKSSQPVGLQSRKFTGNFAISVTDTGIGIPKDKKQLIFDAFQQVDGTTSRRYGGTGLGLSISRQLAKLLGGDISISSIEGKGSTFTLHLPETISSQATISQSSENIPTEILTPTEKRIELLSDISIQPNILQDVEVEPLGISSEEDIIDDRNTLKPEDKSLLIIEDDRKFSTILMELARGQDFKCLLAENGRTGLQLAEEYKPNAIILDAGLPQLDGWTVMDKLKDNSDTRHIPVHFISASDQGLMAKKMGAIGFLHKPVSIEQIGKAFKRIEQFLNQTVKNLLVIVDSEPHQQQILKLMSSGNVEVTIAVTMASSLQHLKTKLFDCIILDMEIEQGAGKQLLEKMDEFDGLCQTPLIIYTNRELTTSEEALLQQCAERLPVKSVKSPEQLLDEATLFLHQLESNLPKEKRNMLKMVHDKEAILKDKKVLIVDDDMRNVFALATILEDKGMEVAVAQNGKEGLAMLENYKDIAIILMDIMMPEMDGYEAMQEIRKQQSYRKLPIIALTAKAMKGDKTKCIEAGANDYLSKPVNTDKLISLMRVWLYR